MVLCIFVERTTPLKILPLMAMFEVNGHFLSIYPLSIAAAGVLKPKKIKIKHSKEINIPRPIFLWNLGAATCFLAITFFEFWKTPIYF